MLRTLCLVAGLVAAPPALAQAPDATNGENGFEYTFKLPPDMCLLDPQRQPDLDYLWSISQNLRLDRIAYLVAFDCESYRQIREDGPLVTPKRQYAFRLFRNYPEVPTGDGQMQSDFWLEQFNSGISARDPLTLPYPLYLAMIYLPDEFQAPDPLEVNHSVDQDGIYIRPVISFPDNETLEPAAVTLITGVGTDYLRLDMIDADPEADQEAMMEILADQAKDWRLQIDAHQSANKDADAREKDEGEDGATAPSAAPSEPPASPATGD